jgi:hypothetical protein
MAFSLIALFAYYLYVQRKLDVSIPLVSIFLAILPLLPIMQAVFGVVFFWGDAWLTSFYLLGVALAFSIGFGLAKMDAERTLVSMGLVLLFAAIISCGMAVYQWLEVGSLGFWVANDNYGERETANIGQPNNLASLLLWGIVACGYLRIKRLLGSFLFWLVTLFLLVGVALTESRTSWVAVSFLVGWWWIKILPIDSKIGRAALIFLFGTYFSFYFLNTPISELLYLPGSGRKPVPDGFVEDGRLAIWMQMYEAMKASSFWGYGWMQAGSAQVGVVADLPPSEEMTAYSHNIILDLLVWNGWVVGGLLVVAGGYWVFSRFTKASSLEARIALLLIGVLLVHSMLEFPFAYTYFLFPMAFFAGFVEFEFGKRLFVVNKLLAAGIFAVSCFVLTLIWRDYRLVEEDFRRLRFEMAGLEPARRGTSESGVLLLDQFPQYINLASMDVAPRMTSGELDWMEKVCHRYPTSRSMFIYTSALFLNGHTEDAALELLRLRNLFGSRVYEEAISQLSQLAIKHDLVFDEEALFLPSK